MSKCVKLSDYLDLSYFKSNYIIINKFINSRLRRVEKIGKKRVFYLEEIIKMLDKNDDKLNQSEYIVNLKTKIELLLVKEDNRSYYKYILDLLEKESLTEDDIISSIAFIDNKKYILKKLVSKVDNILSFNNMTLNIIKDRINDDSFVDEIINEEKRTKAEEIASILENINDTNIDLNFLQTNYNELLEILKTTTLNIKVIEMIITGMNSNIDKIKSNYPNCKDLIYTLEEISNIIKTNHINKITDDVINTSLNIELGSTFDGPLKYTKSNTSFIYQDTPIIALDKQVSLDLDSAFSIDKDNDLYFFNVYVADVPSFLGQNRDLSINSYKQGMSYYLRDKGNTINYDMLPANLSHGYLSMLSKDVSLQAKDAIVFHFVIDKKGNICSSSVNRNKVIVDYNLTSNEAIRILDKEKASSKVDKSIYLLRDLCKSISSSSPKQYLSNLSKVTIDDMIALPSLLVNYYLSKELDFGIYSENGTYTSKPVNDIYLTGSAPLRRYVDDINLAILLELKGLQSFAKDDFRYLENNLDEVIEHLNEQNFLDKYIEKNNALVKKYYLKKRD